MCASVETMLRVMPVHVMWVPGNHDLMSSWFLAQVLRAKFDVNDHFTLDDGPTPRKYHQFGKTLLGFVHGDELAGRDIAAIMATEKPKLWSATNHHEWHLGHFHHRKRTRWIDVDDNSGVISRILPSLSGRDSWHSRMGYTNAGPAADVYLWHSTRSFAGQFPVGTTV